MFSCRKWCQFIGLLGVGQTESIYWTSGISDKQNHFIGHLGCQKCGTNLLEYEDVWQFSCRTSQMSNFWDVHLSYISEVLNFRTNALLSEMLNIWHGPATDYYWIFNLIAVIFFIFRITWWWKKNHFTTIKISTYM